MYQFNSMKRNSDMKKSLIVVGCGLAVVMVTLAGCTNDVPAWWPKVRTFDKNPPVTKSSSSTDASKGSQTAQAGSPTTSPSDPQASRAEQTVNDNLKRMKTAYEKSQQSENSKNADTRRDADLSAQKSITPPDSKADTSEKPVITPIRHSAKITGIEPVAGARPRHHSSPAIKLETEKSGTSEIVPAVEPQKTAETSEKKPRSIPVRVTPVQKEPPAEPAKTMEEASSANDAVVIENTHPANQSLKLEIPDPENANASLDKLIMKLEGKLKEHPGDTSTQVKLHLIYAMLGQWQEALKNNGGKDSTGGELAKNLAAIIKVFDNSELSSAEQANQAMKFLNDLQEILRRQADLKINNIQFCREVKNFAYYTTMPKEYFVAGKRLPVIVYFELENFNSKMLKADSYQTLLAVTIEILDKEGRILWRQHDERVEDLANKQRHDFYIARLVTLPAVLPTGKLQLKLTVEDLNGNKVAQKMTLLELKP
jgi:hypothetical protein